MRAAAPREPTVTSAWGDRATGIAARKSLSFLNWNLKNLKRCAACAENWNRKFCGLDILEATSQILVVPPWFGNVGKRLIKSPKVDVADSGLACHLLGIETAAELEKSPFLGALFEGFIAGEIVKAQANAGRRRELYYFRDQQCLEVDFVMPGRSGTLRLLEAKAARTVAPGVQAWPWQEFVTTGLA